MKADISIAAVLDRDFRCNEEVAELVSDGRLSVPHFHILDAKEIENFLLVPTAISKALEQRLKDRRSPSSTTLLLDAQKIGEILESIVADQKADILGQYVANRVRFFATRSSKDPSTVVKEAITNFDADWSTPNRRIMISSGKKVFATLNGQLQKLCGTSVTSTQVIKHMSQSDLLGLKDILNDLNIFAKTS